MFTFPSRLRAETEAGSESRVLRPPHWGRIYGTGALIALILFLAWVALGGTWPITPDRDTGVHDFRSYYLASLALRMGGPFYDSEFDKVWETSDDSFASLVLTELGVEWTSAEVPVRYVAGARGEEWTRWVAPYLYPPPLAILLAPITLVGFPEARAIWLVINLVLLPACAGLFAITRAAKRAAFGFFLLLLVLNPAVYFTIQLGQVNLLIFFLVIAGFAALKLRRDVPAGVLLGLAASIKITPALFLVFLCMRRSWRAALAMTVTGAASLVVSGSVVGFGTLHRYFFQVLPNLSRASAYVQNQSVPAFVLRIWEADPDVLSTHHPTHLGMAGVFLSVVLFAGIFLPCGWMVWRTRRSAVETESFDLGFAVFALLATVVPSVAWIHHFVPVTLALLVLVEVFPPVSRKALWPVFACWLAYFLLAMPVRLFFKMSLAQGGSWRWLMSNTFYGSMLLLLLLCAALWSQRETKMGGGGDAGRGRQAKEDSARAGTS